MKFGSLSADRAVSRACQAGGRLSGQGRRLVRRARPEAGQAPMLARWLDHARPFQCSATSRCAAALLSQ